MKRLMNWAIVPTTLALLAITAPIAASNPIQTPLRSPVTVQGNSGGSQSNNSCRGFMFSGTPSQVVRVTESMASLRFRVEGQGQLALLITGPGNPICIPASGNAINVPGVWQQGSYSVFVGDRPNTSNSFTLSITQEN